MADTLEMEPKDATALLKQVLPARKKSTVHVTSTRKKQAKTTLRVRLSDKAVIVEAVKVETSGKRRVLKSVRIEKPAEKKKTRSPYASMRAAFEAAAAKHRVAPQILAGHQKQNATTIAEYWKQTPAE